MKAAKDDPCLCALRSFFAERFLLTRDSLGLTQMEFALDLGIDRRSYLDIEHRKNLCCAVTLLAYLCYFCDDPLGILNECRRILDKHLNVLHSPLRCPFSPHITNTNNMHEFDTFMFFKYFVKMWIAVYVVSHTFDIVMAVFDIGQHVVNSAAGIIGGSTAIDSAALITQMNAVMETMPIGELVLLALETLLVSFGMKVMSVIITVVLYGRMIEIYLYSSIAAIPMATLSNREWGQIGNNYLRGLLALAFQGFFLMVCVAIYAVLISTMQISDNMHSALFGIAAYTVMLCFALLKTGSLSKSIFNAH